MALDFGKLNFAVGFNRTSAFPLDANSYFESLELATTAAAGAAEVGSADSAYYIGQLIIVKDTTAGVGLYQITADKKLVKFGQASSADELASAVSALQTRCTTIEGKLILATADKEGLMSKEDFAKLAGIAEGAQVNVIESVKVDGEALAVEGKAVNIDLAGALEPYAKSADVTSELAKKVDAVEGKGLSTNDYDAAAVEEVAKIKDKADSTTVEGINTRLTTAEGEIDALQTQITGLTGAMHFVGTSTTDPMAEGGATVEGHDTFASGDVCLYGNKEFVYNGTAWVELGDEGSHLTKTEAANTYLTKTAAATTYITAEKAAQDIAAAKSEAITDAGNAVDTKLAAYAKSTDVASDIATAKSDAIADAGTAADSKIAEALKSYTTTTELQKSLDLKADKTVVDGHATAIAALQEVGAEKNVIQTVSDEFAIDDARNLTVKAVASSKITGLDTALAGKVDKVTGSRLINETEIEKLEKLVLKEDGSVEVSGEVAAGNVKGLDEWVTGHRADLAGLFSADDAAKLAAIEASAQVNKIETVKVGNTELNVVEKAVNIPIADASTLGVVLSSTAENGVAVAADGKMTVNKINVNKLVQTEGDTLILDGGNA